MEKLTIKEALAAGYTSCGYADREYQTLMSIENIDQDNFDYGGEILIADTEFITPSISAETIKEAIIDEVTSNWCEETYDDTNEVRDSLEEMDFSDVSERINNALKQHCYYKLTKIQLIP